ncbi:FtsX-like permease family protein [Rhodovastum atsumiense]|nr:FtsX-like permease family protein [Rhodovastum atsumiense]CAH2599586.1 FtsX-like permease family protein [Rhodovastum atsumiense]
MWLIFRLARRDLRGGVRGLRIVLACLALGVAAIAAVGTLREGIERGLARDGARLLGGDLAVQGGADPLPQDLRDWLAARGARVSEVVTMRSMLVAPSGERLLVELKAVDAAWPLIGEAGSDPQGAGLAGGFWAEPLVIERLRLQPGDPVRVGTAVLPLRAALTAEPDRVSTSSLFGPRVLIALADLPATGLLAPGAIAEHALRAVLPPGTDVATTITDLRAAFPGTGWRIRDATAAAPGVNRFIDRTSLFMTLVGLTSLLVGGIGVANGVSAWIEARARSIATLRCLGAAPVLVFAICLVQVLALAGLGVLAGLAVGAVLPPLAGWALSGVLPVAPDPGPFLQPLALAAGYGLLTAATFALWPLARAMRISGAALFRDALQPERVRPPGWLIAANLGLVLALVGLTVATAQERLFAAWFCLAALVTLLLFRAGAWGVMRLARRLPAPPWPWARLGLSNLHRPGAPTPLMLVSVGIGLSTLAAVALIEGNLRRQVAEQLPERAPSFFFIDIQNDQMPEFRRIVGGMPSVQDLREVPSLRARIVAVNGVPAEQVQATPETTWALRGDRGLTYAAAMPEGTRLVAGSWWPADYDGRPLVSFDAALARGWGIGLGDVIRVNVLGRDIDLQVASLRDIAWRSLDINFTLVASPGLLARAPHTHIATVRAAPEAQAALLKRVTDALPNVSGIRVADVLATVAALLGQIGAALSVTGAVTLVAGALVLAGAVAAGQRRRIQEAVILKSLGATRSQVRAAWLVEFGILGLAAGLIAALVGTLASWAVVRGVMGADWSFLPERLGLTVLGCVALMLGFGYAGTAAALRARAAPLLRNE